MPITEAVNEFRTISFEAHRYSSFDYCYNYFSGNNGDIILNDMEKSCAVLGFYLASWGMMRGSSFLLQKSYKHFEELIKYIATLERTIWEIQPSEYVEKYETINNLYKDICEKVIEDNNRAIVLITKIMLGVFGIVPAFDEYFCKCFKKIDPQLSKFTSFNKNSLEVIKNFYEVNQIEIDNLSNQIFTKDFINSTQNRFNYTKAKIMDMYGFVIGTKEP
ncbi:MAG: hypothetical protein KKG93_12360 [Bacteroidetes bacterium]|nr:hypothetical protein [Bacteroidota bacterium]